MSRGSEHIDNLLDGFVGAVVRGFEPAIWTVVGIRAVVVVGNSCSDILVVQAAQNWHGQRLTDGLDGAGNRRVLLQ